MSVNGMKGDKPRIRAKIVNTATVTPRHEIVEAILGPRYIWAIHTEPVKRLMDYITALEAKLCQCPTSEEPSWAAAGIHDPCGR